MNTDEFKKYGYEFVDWIANYFEHIDKFPVLSQIEPKSIISQLPANPPQKPESINQILSDFNEKIMPGITHWNHPNFMAYFNSTSTEPGIFAEFLSAALNINGMVWKTSPASTELEELTLNWIRKMINLPNKFWGIIYDLASISSLHAIATAREQIKEKLSNNYDLNKLRIYISEHTHSSIEKAVKTLGIPLSSVVKINTNTEFEMRPDVLSRKIKEDKANGLHPFCVVATIGTTSSTSVDPVTKIAEICKNNELWLHVDAAYAGSAAILPEKRIYFDGIEKADSFVFNPHKWLFIPIDLSILYITKPELLKKTFSVIPEYLTTPEDGQVTNYMDYGIQLGRRFRSLKLWFTIRYFGTEGLQNIIRTHIRLAKKFENYIDASEIFEKLAPVPFSVVCFRAVPNKKMSNNELDAFNYKLLNKINKSGKLFLSHTKLNGKYAIRIAISGYRTKESNVEAAWNLINETTINLVSIL